MRAAKPVTKYQADKRGRGLLLLAPLVAALCGGESPAPAAEVTVLVERSASMYQQAALGFERGFGTSNQLRVIRLNGETRERDRALAELRQKRPNLVVVIGTDIARAARQQLRDVPILYCLALSPRQNGLVGDNIGGVALDVDLSRQFLGIQQALPDVKRIGVIYNEPTSGELIKQTRKYLKEGVRLAPQPVSTPQEAARAIEDFQGKVDAFWLLWDPVIMNPTNFKLLKEFCLRNKIALIAPETPFVEAGALISVGANHLKAGQQTGEMAHLVLQGKARVQEFVAVAPEESVLTINGRVAQRIGYSIPPHLRAEILLPGER